LSFADRILCTNTVLLTNGVLQRDFAVDETASGFWQVVGQR
jgi:hypothetical protein